MKYFKISEHDVQQLLTTIKNAEDRKAIKAYLQALMNSKPGTKRVDAILRSLLKIGETVIIKELIRRLFD